MLALQHRAKFYISFLGLSKQFLVTSTYTRTQYLRICTTHSTVILTKGEAVADAKHCVL